MLSAYSVLAEYFLCAFTMCVCVCVCVCVCAYHGCRASGGVAGLDEPFGDVSIKTLYDNIAKSTIGLVMIPLQTILFTTDEEVLALVAAHDSIFPAHPSNGVSTPIDDDGYERPSTADTTSTEEVCVVQMAHAFYVTDPCHLQEWSNSDNCYNRPLTRTLPFNPAAQPKQSLVEGSVIVLTFLSSWEGGNYVGLTGLELLDSYDHPIPLSPAQLQASSGNDSVGRLVDGENITACENHMWLATCDGSHVYVKISLSEPRVVSGIRVWNYNRPAEEAYRGVGCFPACLLKLLLNIKYV